MTVRILSENIQMLNQSEPTIRINFESFGIVRESLEDFSMENVDRGFSFKNNVMDNEFVQNPNIFEGKDFNELKNNLSNPKDKFIEQQSGFFDLDEEPSRVAKIKTLQTQKDKILKQKITTKSLGTSVSKSSKFKRGKQ